MAYAENNQPQLALHYFKAGLNRNPHHFFGRLSFAEFYFAFDRPDLARDLLRLTPSPERLTPTEASDLLHSLLRLEAEQDVIRFAGILAHHNAPLPQKQLCLIQAARAYLNLGDTESAAATLNNPLLANLAAIPLLKAENEIERGYPEVALLLLEQHFLRNAPSDPAALALRTQLYRTTGNYTAWESSVLELLATSPDSPSAQLELIRLTHHRRDEIATLVDDFLHQHAHNTESLLQLSDFGAATGQPAIPERILTDTQTGPAATNALTLLLAEAHLNAGQPNTTLAQIDALEKKLGSNTERHLAAILGLRALAHARLGQTDQAKHSLNTLLSLKNLRTRNLISLAHKFINLGDTEHALAIFAKTVQLTPGNEKALTELIKLRLEADNLAAHSADIHKFAALRRPARDVATRAYRELASDRYLFLPDQRTLLETLEQSAPSRAY